MSPFLLPSDDSSPELAASEPCPKALIPPERQLEEGQQARAPEEVRGLSMEETLAKDAQLERALEVLQEE